MLAALLRDRKVSSEELTRLFLGRIARLDPGLNALYGSELVSPAYQRELRIFQARRTSLDQQLATLAEQLKAIELERRALLPRSRPTRTPSAWSTRNWQ